MEVTCDGGSPGGVDTRALQEAVRAVVGQVMRLPRDQPARGRTAKQRGIQVQQGQFEGGQPADFPKRQRAPTVQRADAVAWSAQSGRLKPDRMIMQMARPSGTSSAGPEPRLPSILPASS